jgi:hypothetical protein
MSNLDQAAPIADLLRALGDLRIYGGCDHCDAYQTAHPDHWGPGLHRITIHHDDWCPQLRQVRQ